ncbi:hypothetical protein EV385_3077 [Krasilnikovia cinnamomea]|uniref:Uncharacterized protein n=1 Tax=Krasilnikovia cinnamomea TaxID=349313 RepID=A0A4Q7ZK31_9ACTN|nr:hypothetical protein [Krasilnikovia cinnamomea]RZU51267.1 hypothetical protein EV385_3077 [Krasilnikovia cinnamomea]
MGDYSGFDVKQLFNMVEAAEANLAPSHAQVDALNRAQQTLSAHQQALKNARAQLALRWPPETNAASNAYLVELDRLIAAVGDTALNCAVNVMHINLVSTAIVESRKTLKPMYDEYVANESALAKYEQEVHEFGDGAKDIPFGKNIAEGAKRLFSDPPVADGRQDELTQRVRQEMTSLAGAAQDGAARIQPPIPYQPPKVEISRDRIDEPPRPGGDGGGSTGGAVRPPRIDPPAHTRTPADGAVSAPGDQVGGAVVTSPVAGAHPGSSGSGPGLAGVIAPPALPTPVQPVPGAGIGPVPAPPGGVAGALPGLLPALGGAAAGLGPISSGGRIAGGVPAGELGAMRSAGGPLGGLRNGVIGGVPGVGEGPGVGRVPGMGGVSGVGGGPGVGRVSGVGGAGEGGLRGGAGARPRINPVGGVIGQEPGAGSAGRGPGARIAGQAGIAERAPGGRAAGQAGMAGRGSGGRGAGSAGMAERGPGGRAGGPMGMAGARGGRRGHGDSDEGQRWDPDNPWATAEGVDSVIAPDPASGDVDPGPGIIGLHR